MAAELSGFLPSFIITFRETLEAALVIGVVLAFLFKTRQASYSKFVYWGAGFGIIGSIAAAFLFNALVGGFEGTAEELFEGTLMLVGAALVSWMILWMMQQRNIAKKIEEQVEHNIMQHNALAITLLVFVSVLREGVETVIFLGALGLREGASVSTAGAAIGIIVALLFGYALFRHFISIRLKTVFTYTSILLIFFAAGLVAHGIHELEEAGVVPVLVEHVWDINPEVNPDGSYPLLHENGLIGSIAKGLFGYNGNPSLLEVIGYMAYLVLMYFLWKKYSANSNK